MRDPKLDRNLVLLAADDRFVRRNALKVVQTAIKHAGKSNCEDFPLAVYVSHLSLSLNDTAEVNRKLAVVVNKDLIDAVPSVSVILPSLLPAPTKRLGQKGVIGPSEELRLETLRLLKTVLDKSVDVNPYVDDYPSIFRVTISDAFYELLPLILSGFTDDSEEIRGLTADSSHDVGLEFEKESEEQLKDKVDFDKGPPLHCSLGCKRPVVGCRELVYRSASRLLPALCRDLSDWQEATRTKAPALLPILVVHLEESTTQHTQHLITGLTTGLAYSFTPHVDLTRYFGAICE
ncbi:unnamed protein product [Calicophoron daubneyi]|uniref:Uncharacterized protein n=1 Tax=Calicophoron daubneyi TaxID=300641 RepID=A0AAV2TBE2_CALDB